MRRGMRTAVATVAVLLYLVVVADRWSEGRAQSAAPAPKTGSEVISGGQSTEAQTASPTPAASPAETPVSPQRALIDQYCMGCHSDRVKSGGLALSQLNLDSVD